MSGVTLPTAATALAVDVATTSFRRVGFIGSMDVFRSHNFDHCGSGLLALAFKDRSGPPATEEQAARAGLVYHDPSIMP